jgi:cephalosporin hydroxylase
MVDFKQEVVARIAEYTNDSALRDAASSFMLASTKPKYSYNFEWMGRPVIQYPQDIVAVQELIWQVKPDLIVETGIAHGGSLVFSASMLALLDLCEVMGDTKMFDPGNSRRKVLGVDIDIRQHNRMAIEAHPMASRIQMIQGSSIAPEIIAQVCAIAAGYSRVMVCLDSNHTHDHVLAELNAYASLASVGSYCVVFDTVVEDLPKEMFLDRPWGPGNSPRTAVHEFLNANENFVIDKEIHNKLLITVAQDGYLKRIR